jgi:TolB-like protein
MSDQKSIAVLAFENLSDDKGNEYFSDGISEELLNVLAKVPGLKVAARSSAFYFKGKQVPIAEIAKQLDVAFLLEGSVRKAGNRVRITAQLIKASDGFQVWTDNIDRELKDIFAVQDEIAGLIAKTSLPCKMKSPDSSRKTSSSPWARRLGVLGRSIPRPTGLFLRAGIFGIRAPRMALSAPRSPSRKRWSWIPNLRWPMRAWPTTTSSERSIGCSTA